jgi:hypothetical protein
MHVRVAIAIPGAREQSLNTPSATPGYSGIRVWLKITINVFSLTQSLLSSFWLPLNGNLG